MKTAGYDPENGDWEYFYQEAGGPLESGKMANCIGCHRQVAEKGYVFGRWAKAQKGLLGLAPGSRGIRPPQ